MDHSLEQLLIDVFVASRERLASENQLHEIISSHTLNSTAPKRLSQLLVERGLINAEQASGIDDRGSTYREVLRTLGLGAAQATAEADQSSSASEEFDTLMENSSLDTPSSQRSASFFATQPGIPDHFTLRNDRYSKTHPHAEGGLGRVWIAADSELNRKVALKEIQPTHADDPSCRTRFVREAEITSSLQHPGIVPIYGLGCQADGRPFYAMKFVEGKTLKREIDELFDDQNVHPYKNVKWRIRFRRVLNRFLDVCNTIDYAHSRGVIHRDIKPSNIMLGEYGETLVVDWGLAKSISDEETPAQLTDTGNNSGDLTMIGTAIGTPAYMSPEQASANDYPVTNRSDVYSLGATLFHLLTGSAPTSTQPGNATANRELSDPDGSEFESAKEQQQFSQYDQLPLPNLLRDTVPRPLSHICLRAMNRDPGARYSSAMELASDIENWLADQPISAYRESPAEKTIRWAKSHPTTLVSTLVASILVVAASIIGLSLRNRYQLDILKEQQEQTRITQEHRQQISAAVDAAEASAIAEIGNGRYEAAIEFLAGSLQQLENEPILKEKQTAIEGMLERTKRLLEFETHMENAEELAFRDSSRRASILFQRALVAVGAFERREWWNALPSDDLNPVQLHRLQNQVYRAMFLLTALRLKETIPADLNVVEMLKLLSSDSKISNQASLVLFDQMDAFRASQGSELGRSFATNRTSILNRVIQGLTFRQTTIEWEAQNASDLYIMGSALAYMAVQTDEESRKPFETLLGIENAANVSREMLTTVSELNREHYWVQLVRAFFEAQRGEYDQAWRSYSHAISLNPENWIGYAWLGDDLKNYAAGLPADSDQRKTALQRSDKNLERAVDLNPSIHRVHTIRGHILTWLLQDPLEAISSYNQALGLQEPLDRINDAVVEQVDRSAIVDTRNWCEQSATNYTNYAQLRSSAAWAELILGNHKEAHDSALKALQINPSDHIAQMVAAQAATHFGNFDEAENILSQLCAARSNWFHAVYARALNEEEREAPELAKQYYERAYELSQCSWQKLHSQTGVARTTLQIASPEEASTEVAKAILTTNTERFDDLLDTARLQDAQQAVKILERYHEGLQPITSIQSPTRLSSAPLLNGGFELGLVPAWGDSIDKIDRPTWERFGGSIAKATVVSGDAYEGSKSLRITNISKAQEDVYSELSQKVPVSPDFQYDLFLAAQSDGCESGAISVLINDDVKLALPSGKYDWQLLSIPIQPDSNSLDVRIQCTGRAQASIDAIRIRKRETLEN